MLKGKKEIAEGEKNILHRRNHIPVLTPASAFSHRGVDMFISPRNLLRLRLCIENSKERRKKEIRMKINEL